MAVNKGKGGGKSKSKAVGQKKIAGSALSQNDKIVRIRGSKSKAKVLDTNRPPQSGPPKKKLKG